MKFRLAASAALSATLFMGAQASAETVFSASSWVPPTHTLSPADARRYYLERRAVTHTTPKASTPKPAAAPAAKRPPAKAPPVLVAHAPTPPKTSSKVTPAGGDDDWETF